jgi:hypothetical protein
VKQTPGMFVNRTSIEIVSVHIALYINILQSSLGAHKYTEELGAKFVQHPAFVVNNVNYFCCF